MMALSDGLLGCDLGCDKESSSKDPTLYPLRAEKISGGRVNIDRTFYETNDWDESFVDFPAGRKLLIEHGLGIKPEVFTWLSFIPNPFQVGEDDRQGNAAESAGNMVTILNVTDEYVQVRNDTCQDFFLRLVAISPGEFGDGAGQGGTEGAAGAGGSE